MSQDTSKCNQSLENNSIFEPDKNDPISSYDSDFENATFLTSNLSHFLANLVSNDYTSSDIIGIPGEKCYPKLNKYELEEFHDFERNLMGFAVCGVGLFGIIGNIINLIVLSHKDMRGNCFNQLLIGKFYSIFQEHLDF